MRLFYDLIHSFPTSFCFRKFAAYAINNIDINKMLLNFGSILTESVFKKKIVYIKIYTYTIIANIHRLQVIKKC